MPFWKAAGRRKTDAAPAREHGEKMLRLRALTPREYETYEILLEGFTLRYAAEQMGVKYPTVNTYVNAIYRKLGVSSRAQLISRYIGTRLPKDAAAKPQTKI
ncbi:MAG: helix-turn-helix transcriptional regulator [Oscillospiraceae bacterium]|nr:helix-turn-helix transcriptional regulator [Oscillospiraceae bacterium]